MERENVTRAIKEAERFLQAAKRAELAFDKGGWSNSPKDTAAARRASLDLTRALADMRRR